MASNLERLRQEMIVGSKRLLTPKKNTAAAIPVIPLMQRFGTKIEYTGLGPDGKLQASNPTGMMQTNLGPRMIHEGEIKIQYPDGRFDVIPANQVSQNVLKYVEQRGNIKGYQEGTDSYNEAQQALMRGPISSGGYGQVNTSEAELRDRAITGDINSPEAIAARAARAPMQTVKPYIPKPSVGGYGQVNTSEAELRDRAITGDINSPEAIAARAARAPKHYTGPTSRPYGSTLTSTPEEEARRQASVTTRDANGNTVYKFTTPTHRAGEPVGAGTTSTGTSPRETGLFGGGYQGYFNQALRATSNLSRGISPAMDTISRNATQDLAGKNAAEAQAAGQTYAQRGITGGALAAATGQLQAGQRGDMATLEGTLAGQRATLSEAANTALANFGMQGMNHELEVEKYNYGKSMDTFNAQVAAGDYAGANATAAKAGLPIIDFSKVIGEKAKKDLSDGLTNLATSYTLGYDNAVVQGDLQSIWKNTPGNEGKPMDLTWARNTYDDIVAHNDPITGDIYGMLENPSTSTTMANMFGVDDINTYTYKGKIGKEAALRAWVDLKSGGAITIDPTTGQVTYDADKIDSILNPTTHVAEENKAMTDLGFTLEKITSYANYSLHRGNDGNIYIKNPDGTMTLATDDQKASLHGFDPDEIASAIEGTVKGDYTVKKVNGVNTLVPTSEYNAAPITNFTENANFTVGTPQTSEQVGALRTDLDAAGIANEIAFLKNAATGFQTSTQDGKIFTKNADGTWSQSVDRTKPVTIGDKVYTYDINKGWKEATAADYGLPEGTGLSLAKVSTLAPGNTIDDTDDAGNTTSYVKLPDGKMQKVTSKIKTSTDIPGTVSGNYYTVDANSVTETDNGVVIPRGTYQARNLSQMTPDELTKIGIDPNTVLNTPFKHPDGTGVYNVIVFVNPVTGKAFLVKKITNTGTTNFRGNQQNDLLTNIGIMG